MNVTVDADRVTTTADHPTAVRMTAMIRAIPDTPAVNLITRDNQEDVQTVPSPDGKS